MNEEESKPLILIVDDVPKNLQVLGTILRKEDFRIAAAVSGPQALEMVEKIRPDLILLDIMMPGMDGFEVCVKLKADPMATAVPIIFLTAKSETADVVKGFSCGAVDYVTKPFNTSELLARVHTHMELKKARDKEKKLIADLENALSQVKRLSGLLPICANCKNVRDDKGYWRQVEEYISRHSDVIFSHSLCPTCVEELYPQVAKELLSDR